ncbi:MAG: glycosyltransferase [Patescibacteria group bacterium]|jgi:GT2 family glycosyltransferase
MSKKISAVIVNYNNKKDIVELLSALIEMKDTVQEIIVVDDCSTDNGPELIRRLFPSVLLLTTSTNSGPGSARNIGIRQAKSKLVLCLDSDMEIQAKDIERLVSHSVKNTNYQFYIPRIVFSSNRKLIQHEDCPFHYLGFSLRCSNYGKNIQDCDSTARAIDTFQSGCFLFVRRPNHTVRPFDENYFYGFEDLDFSFQNTIAGNRAILIPTAIACHKNTPTQGLSFKNKGKYPTRRLFYIVRNKWIFVLKNYPITTLVLILPLELMLDAGTALYSTLYTNDKFLVLKSYASLMRAMPNVLSRRRNRCSYQLNSPAALIKNKPMPLPQVLEKQTLLSSLLPYLNKLLFAYGKYILRLK